MGVEQTTTVAALTDRCNWELRNSDDVQYTDPEQLVYYNKTVELLHQVLIDEESALVRTGTGTLATVNGTETYDLSANSMGDLWIPYKVWIAGSDPMEQCEEGDRWEYIDSDGNLSNDEPSKYYLDAGHYIGFLDEPDAVYTVNFVYYPNYVYVTVDTGNVPYRGLLNSAIIEGMKMWARNRSRSPASVEAALLAYFQDMGLKLDRKRRVRQSAITVRKR